MIFSYPRHLSFSCSVYAVRFHTHDSLSLILNQIGKGSRGDVTILPTLVINSRQYRGLMQLS